MIEVESIVAALVLSAVAMSAPCSYPIQWEGSGREVIAVELNPETLGTLGGCLDSVRIRDREGADVPYAVCTLSESYTQSVRKPCGAVSSLVREVPGNTLRMEFKLLTDSPIPNGLTISSPLQNYERKVDVFVSRDGAAWLPLVTGAFIFDSTSTLKMRQTDIALPATDCRQFRLIVSLTSIDRQNAFKRVKRSLDASGQPVSSVEETTVTNEPFKIDDVSFWRKTTSTCPGKPLDILAPPQCIERVAESKTSVYLFKPVCYPVLGVFIESPEQNFSRLINAFNIVGDKQSEQLPVSVVSLHFPGYKEIEPRMQFQPAFEDGTIRLVVNEFDNPPLPVISFRTIHARRCLRFLAEPGSAPFILTASPGAERPQYQLPQMLAAKMLEEKDVVFAPLGKHTGEPICPEPSRKDAASYGWLIYVACIAAAIAVAAALYMAFRQLPAEDNSPDA